jgi:predicted flap endonuclease-1-like 5' DNA nuclease
MGVSWEARQAARTGGLPWWGWLLIIVAIIVVAWLIWWCLRRRRARATEKELEIADMVAGGEPVAAEGAVAADVPGEPVEPDDLKVIEGIGPKVASLLAEIGIVTFSQLAEADMHRVRDVLNRARLPMIDPSTWPEQASLAAEGKWEELDALRDALKGGRRA